MNIKLRKATLKDLKEIDEIYKDGVIREVKSQYPRKSEKEIIKELNKYKKDRLNGFKKNIKSKLAYLGVALAEDKIVGFGEVVINKDDKRNAEFTKAYIKKEWIGKGIATMMMKQGLKWLKSRGIKEVYSGIFVKNIPSVKLNEKFGFKITAVRMVKKIK